MINDIKRIMVETLNLNEEQIKPESNLKEDLEIDSLAAVELALELETELGIRIEDEELAKLITFQDIVDIVTSKKEQ
ncbi:MAG: acyl carrier protein [Tenericutes bacterium]|nr:acyl carrier protein [Mycoplasmatota bacterium]